MKERRGFTLAEAIVYVAILAVMMSLVATMSISSEQFFRSGNASVDIQESMDKVLIRLAHDLRESDPKSIAVDYSAGGGSSTYVYPSPSNGYNVSALSPASSPQLTTAIVMLSARASASKNVFDYGNLGNCGSASNPGIPCWHKWVAYYLCPDPRNISANQNCPAGYTGTASASTRYALIRVETTNGATSAGQSLPVLSPAPPSTASGSWETSIRVPSDVQVVEVLATNLNRFCVTNPLSTSFYNDPFNFDAPTGGSSNVNFTGLPYFWINMEGEEYTSAVNANSYSNRARNAAQVLVGN